MSTAETSVAGDLGEFLRDRRSRLTPQDAGIVSYGRRRVPGLRREELAQLAGVSATYYARLEQGQSTNASASVIDAIARALDLDDTGHRILTYTAVPGTSSDAALRLLAGTVAPSPDTAAEGAHGGWA